MSHAYMVRITHAYQDASGVVALWAARCEKMVVYEHVGTKTEKIHIHMVMFGCDTHKKQLRNIGMATGLELKGNKFCSFKEWDGTDRPCVYMTKGQHDPSFVKGYTSQDTARWKSLWVTQEEGGKDVRYYNECFGDWDAHLVELNRFEHANSLDPKPNMYWRFTFVKSIAHRYTFQKCGYIWNLKAINIYKMLVYTYCMRENVMMPDKDPVFKSF